MKDKIKYELELLARIHKILEELLSHITNEEDAMGFLRLFLFACYIEYIEIQKKKKGACKKEIFKRIMVMNSQLFKSAIATTEIVPLDTENVSNQDDFYDSREDFEARIQKMIDEVTQ